MMIFCNKHTKNVQGPKLWHGYYGGDIGQCFPKGGTYTAGGTERNLGITVFFNKSILKILTALIKLLKCKVYTKTLFNLINTCT